MWKSVLGAAALIGLVVVDASAATVTKTNTTFRSVDNNSGTVTVDFLSSDFGASSIITGVTTSIQLAKCGVSIDANGCSGGSSTPFNNEIGLALIAPNGTAVSLIENNGDNEAFETANKETFITGSGNFEGTLTFDDSGAALGSSPATGTFAPEGLLGNLIGLNGIGTWTLFFEDDVGSDPLGIYSFSVTIETDGDGVSTVPVPAALPLLAAAFGGLGLIGWGKRRKAA